MSVPTVEINVAESVMEINESSKGALTVKVISAAYLDKF